jgi:hypothetical protein
MSCAYTCVARKRSVTGSVRRVGRSWRGSGRRPESAGRGIMEHAKRLCAMHPCRARRNCKTSRGLQPEPLDSLRGKLSIGVHRGVEVTDTAGEHRPLVSQALCSALPVAYTRVPHSHWEAFASLVLQAAYEEAAKQWLERRRKSGPKMRRD